jgi:hypothetical protein
MVGEIPDFQGSWPDLNDDLRPDSTWHSFFIVGISFIFMIIFIYFHVRVCNHSIRKCIEFRTFQFLRRFFQNDFSNWPEQASFKAVPSKFSSKHLKIQNLENLPVSFLIWSLTLFSSPDDLEVKDEDFLSDSYNRNFWITIVMSEHLVAWIRRVASFRDTTSEEEHKLVHNTLSMHMQEPLDVFVVRRLILIHSKVEVMNLMPTQIQSIYYFLLEKLHYLLSIRKLLLVPVPCAVSPHMDINARIKVWTKGIVIYVWIADQQSD